MSYFSFYRKYRPKNFQEILGQDNNVQILQNSITQNKIVHAYLFSGQRGTGKTSTARVFAKSINCTNFDGNPCLQCSSCLALQKNSTDLVEVDAASNSSVEQMRTLLSQTAYVPLECKYRIFIIDEVHMLSNSAFNAMLKVLEETPAHLVFILATTLIDKVPTTILSRCQNFTFINISQKVIFNHLKAIAELENIHIEDYVLYKISNYVNGSLRDALSILDQLAVCSKDAKITDQLLNDLYGLIDNKTLINILQNILNQSLSGLLNIYDKLYLQNTNFVSLAYSICDLIVDFIQHRSGAIESFKFDQNDLDLLAQNHHLGDWFLCEIINKIKSFLYHARGYTDAAHLFKLLIFDWMSVDVSAQNTIKVDYVKKDKASMSVEKLALDNVDGNQSSLKGETESFATNKKDINQNWFVESDNKFSEKNNQQDKDNFDSNTLEPVNFDWNKLKNGTNQKNNTDVAKDIDKIIDLLDPISVLDSNSKDNFVSEESASFKNTSSHNNDKKSVEDANSSFNDDSLFDPKPSNPSDVLSSFEEEKPKNDEINEDEGDNLIQKAPIFQQGGLFSSSVKKVVAKNIEIPDEDDVDEEKELKILNHLSFPKEVLFNVIQQKDSAENAEIQTFLNKLKKIKLDAKYNLIQKALLKADLELTSSNEIILTFDIDDEEFMNYLNHVSKQDKFKEFLLENFDKIYNVYAVPFVEFRQVAIDFRKAQQAGVLKAPYKAKSFFVTKKKNKNVTSLDDLIKIINS